MHRLDGTRYPIVAGHTEIPSDFIDYWILTENIYLSGLSDLKMPSTSHCRRLLAMILLVCVCSNPVAAAVTDPDPSSAASACFPGVDKIDQGEAVGDIVELEMLLCFSGSVHVAGPGYEGNVTLGDGKHSGQVTLKLNTYRKGARAFGVTSSVLDSVPMNATGNGSFQPGSYTLTIRNGGDDVVETVTFELGTPRAEDLSVFRAPRGAVVDLRSVDAVREARAVSRVDSHRRFDDVNSSQHLPLATNETLIVSVRADGLEGTMVAANGTPLARFRTAIRETGTAFATRQTYETVTPERRPLTPDTLNSSATHLAADPTNDTYYLVVDTRDLWGEWEGNHGRPVHIGSHEGAGYAVRFSMQGAINESNPPADLVAADFRVVDAAVDFSRQSLTDNDIRLAAAQRRDARLLARASTAPGTTLRVRVAGLPDGPVEQTVQVEPLPDGPGFEVPLNLSGVQNGTILRLTVQRGNDTLEDRLEAVVRTPRASIDIRSQSSRSSLWIHSLSVSHPSIVAAYTENGSLAGTVAVDAGLIDGLSVPLQTNTSGTYRVVLYQDLDRTGSLTSPDEPYQQNGSDVGVTVDIGGSESPATQTETPTATNTPVEAKTETTRTQAPGFGVLAGVIGLLFTGFALRQSRV